MDAKIMGLNNLFDLSVSYRIPEFQRPYAWGVEQWESLWDDIRKVTERLLRTNDPDHLLPHFLGAIVVQPRTANGHFDEVRQILVVDGQQRLTTLQLLLKSVQAEFTSSMVSTFEFDDLHDYLFNEPRHTAGDYLNETKIRQSNGLDQADFQDIVRGRLDSNRPPRPLVQAFRTFRSAVNSWLNESPAEVLPRSQSLYKVLTEYLKLATIELDHSEKPHFIFEILNTRGERLKEADYIKNTVMYEADVIDDAQKANSLWGMFEDDWWRKEESRGRDLQMQLDRFLNYWCSMRLGDNVTMRRTAAAFRNHVEVKKETAQTPIEDVVEDVKKAGLIYRRIEENKLPGIDDFIKRIRILDITVVMPPLLWLYTHDVSDSQRMRAISAIESYLVRRALCNLGSQGLNRVFMELIKHLESATDVPPDESVIGFLRDQTAENRIWPDDKRVEDYLYVNPMPGNASRRKMVLEAIETQIRPHMAEEVGDTSNLTVEHLLPQTWLENDWPLSNDGTDRNEAIRFRNAHIPSIGNLTLATKELNSSMSNRSWGNKRRALNEYSGLFLNKALLEAAQATWDEDAIEGRNQQLASIAVQIWPHANGL